MGFVENAIIALTKKKLSKALDLNNVVEISSEGLKEFRDISYKNRSEKELKMDIFQPVVDKPFSDNQEKYTADDTGSTFVRGGSLSGNICCCNEKVKSIAGSHWI